MALRTLEELRNKVRDFIDEDDEARWTDTELDSYINMAYSELVNKIRNAHTGYYEKTGTLTTVANNKIATLPADFAGTITALQDENNNPIQHIDKRVFHLKGVLEYGIPTHYSFFGGTSIWLWKTPDAEYNFAIDYEYMPPELEEDTDEIVYPVGYERNIIWRTVIDCKLKDHQGLQELSALLDRKEVEMLKNLRPTQTFRSARARCLNTERNRL